MFCQGDNAKATVSMESESLTSFVSLTALLSVVVDDCLAFSLVFAFAGGAVVLAVNSEVFVLVVANSFFGFCHRFTILNRRTTDGRFRNDNDDGVTSDARSSSRVASSSCWSTTASFSDAVATKSTLSRHSCRVAAIPETKINVSAEDMMFYCNSLCCSKQARCCRCSCSWLKK